MDPDKTDPLAQFAEWEGQELGDDIIKRPGFYGLIRAPKLHLHYAGAHVVSTARQDRNGKLHPAVWIRVAIKVIGTETYHIVEGMMDAPMAKEFAEALQEAAERAPLDIAAKKGRDEDL